MTTENTAFRLDDEGNFFRGDEQIGKLSGDELTIQPEFKNYQAAAKRWINKQADDELSEVPAAPAPAKDTRSSEQKEKDDIAHIERMEKEATAKTNAVYQSDLDHSRKTGCPPPPKKNPALGDKTPEFVKWLHDYRHDEFLKRYGVTGKGKIPILTLNPHTNLDEVTGEKEVYFAKRKTCLTEVDVTREGLSAEMGDW